MVTKIISIESLIEKASANFVDEFSRTPTLIAYAPGRVNLIGEHTDYNEGFVFPMALPLVTVIVGAKSSTADMVCKVKSLDIDDDKRVDFLLPINSSNIEDSHPQWLNYVKGVIANFHCDITGFEAIIISSVPIGGGLSSSAALEVATYTFLEALMNSNASSLKMKALACQKAEHDFAKVPCGIMDQFISTMGVPGNALLIDCRSLVSTLVPLNDPSVTFVIINSNVRHTLSGSEYPSRRNDCFAAAKIMDKKSLREATMKEFDEYKKNMTDVMIKRARHVISEIERTSLAKEALLVNDYVTFGKLMTQSHNSLKNDFEVSCPELDEIVNIANSIPGVYGCRLTGGGFGGCTVSLVKQSHAQNLIDEVTRKYSKKATFYICLPSGGAKIISSNH